MAKRQETKAKARPAAAQKAQPASGCDTRVCVPAPMPVCCPHCRSSRTTMANGVHYNVRFGARYEHRVCGACGYTFTATRRMTADELARKGV